MSSLNKKAKEVVEKYDVSACTDVTGFGLLGHGAEMATASGVCLNLDVRKIPYFADAVEYAKMGLIPAGAYKNRGHSEQYVDIGSTPEHYVDLLYDPQTSGGTSRSAWRRNRQMLSWKILRKRDWIREWP